MEISKLKVATTATLALQTPDGAPTDVKIFLTSRETGEAKRLVQRNTEKRISMLALGKKVKPNYTEMDEDALEVTCACIVGWEGLVENGEPVPCTPENKRRFMTGEFAWIREAVEETLGDREVFFKSSSTN